MGEHRRRLTKLQQAQPFWSSTTRSAVLMLLFILSVRTSLASTFTAATSFTTAAIRSCSLFSKACFSSVVFPAPKNPDKTVMGVLDGAVVDIRERPAAGTASRKASIPRENFGILETLSQLNSY